jgi:hypothetical protein
MIGPYLVLFAADEAQLSALQVGVFMSVIAVSGLAGGSWRSPPWRSRWSPCRCCCSVRHRPRPRARRRAMPVPG